MTTISLQQAYQQLILGNVIAYPTEAVFGLGCDPECEQAVHHILALKNRPIEKGLILIAANFEQFSPYIDLTKITLVQQQLMLNSWPGPVTWIVPKNNNTPYFLTGQFDSIAIRVTDHPIVQKLCQLFDKPIISTSANISGQAPARTMAEVETQFGQKLPILQGEIGKRINPSEIRDIETGLIIRQG